ncbi:MAG: hypothetical protein FWC96_06040 [Oscillospiraceae bacterium]|nr:hypothetical protein [Oscillospiraceae bacterium]
MTRQKVREIAKVAVVSILSIGLFSTALMGVNNWAFARAVNSTHSFPLPTEAVEIAEDLLPEGFVIPEFTINLSPWQRYQEISAQAMAMEDAAQIGAEYIWAVFGTCIDGMHVEMQFSDWDWHTRTLWQGQVYQSEQALIDQHARDEAIREALTHDPDADISIYGHHEPTLYSFMIDAVTGARVDISYNNPSSARAMFSMSADDAMASRRAMTESGVWEMDIYAQMAFVDLSNEQLEAYAQTAVELAQRHFNNSAVEDVQFSHLSIGPDFGGDLTALVLTGIVFTATDDTGREAHVRIPAGTPFFNSVSISTQHNDFIPGRDGGIG